MDGTMLKEALRKELVRLVDLKHDHVKAIDSDIEEIRLFASALMRLRKMVDPETDLVSLSRMKLSRNGFRRSDCDNGDRHTRDGYFASFKERINAIGQLLARRGPMTVAAIALTLRDSTANIYNACSMPGHRHYFSRDERGIFLSVMGERRFPCNDYSERDERPTAIYESETNDSCVPRVHGEDREVRVSA